MGDNDRRDEMKTKITTEFPEMAYLLAYSEEKHLAPLYARLQLWERMKGLKQFFGFSDAIDARLRIWFNDHTLAGRAVTDRASLEALLKQNALADQLSRDLIQMLVNPSRSIFKKKVQRYAPLHWAILIKDLDIVTALLKEGAKVDYQTVKFAMDEWPDNYSMDALKRGKKVWRIPHERSTQIVIKDATEPDDFGEIWELTVPMMRRIQQILVLLIEHGDDSCMHKTDHLGRTFLHRACSEMDPCSDMDQIIVTAMLKAGAAINQVDQSGRYPDTGGWNLWENQRKAFFEALMEAPLCDAEKMYKRWKHSSYIFDESVDRKNVLLTSPLTHLMGIVNPQEKIDALKYALELDEEGKPSNALSYLMHSFYFRVAYEAIDTIKDRLCALQSRLGVEYGSHRGAYHSRRPYLVAYGPQQTTHPHPMENLMGDQRMESMGL
jgi:hypothetical protein